MWSVHSYLQDPVRQGVLHEDAKGVWTSFGIQSASVDEGLLTLLLGKVKIGYEKLELKQEKQLSSGCHGVHSTRKPTRWKCAWKMLQNKEKGATLPTMNTCILLGVVSVVTLLGLM